MIPIGRGDSYWHRMPSLDIDLGSEMFIRYRKTITKQSFITSYGFITWSTTQP